MTEKEIEENLLSLAKDYRNRSHSPYSGFAIGAAVLSKDFYGGTNIENAAYPSGLCAERVAFFSARAADKNFQPSHLLVYTDQDQAVVPCAGCLQVITEFADKNLKILLAGKNGIIDRKTLGDLLPYSF